MNINKKFLSLAISAVLALGVVSYPMIGYSGNDNEHGNSGNDNEHGNSGNDNEHGNSGNDNEHGNSGNDNEHGNSGNDNEHGNSGNSGGSSGAGGGCDTTSVSGNDPDHHADSGLRGCPDAKSIGKSDSNTNAKSVNRKITVCHIPKGNPANRHTIHISANAWPAHSKHVDKTGQYRDYLGSCNTEVKKTEIDATGEATVAVQAGAGAITSTDTSKVQYVVNPGDCKNTTAWSDLVTKSQYFFDPVVVDDDALDDVATATAVSQCLDNGDSTDSAKNGADSSKKSDSGKHKDGGKGQGRDSVSDSTKTGGKKVHKIRGCQDKDTRNDRKDKDDSAKHDANAKGGKHGLSDSNTKRLTDPTKADSNKNFRSKLKGADSGHDNDHRVKDPLIVSDSSLDDKDVFAAVKKCAGGKGGDSNKLDSSKMGYHKTKGDSGKNKTKGDSGHKQHEIKTSDCGDAGTRKLEEALQAYKDKAKTNTTVPVILNQAALNDIGIQDALQACDLPADPRNDTSSNIPVTVPKTTIENPVITDPTFGSGGSTTSGGSVSGGTISGGGITATINCGIPSGGTVSNGVTTGATVTGTIVGNGAVTNATVDNATITELNADGTVKSGTVINGAITNGTIVSGSFMPVGGTALATTGELLSATFTASTLGTPVVCPTDGSSSGGSSSGGSSSGGSNAKGNLGRSNWREISKPAK